MNRLLLLLICILLAVVLHELAHYAAMVYYGVRIKMIILTWWSALGYLMDHRELLKSRRKTFVVYFCPHLWSLLVLIDPKEICLWMFPLANIFGGLGDFYIYLRLMSIPLEKRLELADRMDEKILKTAIWKKEFKR